MSLRHGLGSLSAAAGARSRLTGCHDRVSLAITSASSASIQRLQPAGGLRMAKGPIEIAFHDTALGPICRRGAYPDGPADLVIAAADVGRQQNLNPLSLQAARLPPF